jgi:hypothetical protein
MTHQQTTNLVRARRFCLSCLLLIRVYTRDSLAHKRWCGLMRIAGELARLGLTWALTKFFQGWIKSTVQCGKQSVRNASVLVNRKQGAAKVRNMNLGTLYFKLLRTNAYKHDSFQPEVVMAIGRFLSQILLKIQVFWDMMLCRLVKSPTLRWCSRQLRPWRWRQQAPPGMSVITYRPIVPYPRRL